MPKVVEVFADNQGKPHNSLEEAMVADITALFDNPGMAKLIWEKKPLLEALFQDYHELVLARDGKTVTNKTFRVAGGGK